MFYNFIAFIEDSSFLQIFLRLKLITHKMLFAYFTIWLMCAVQLASLYKCKIPYFGVVWKAFKERLEQLNKFMRKNTCKWNLIK